MKQLIGPIRQLSRTWEVWAILGFITVIVMAMSALINRQPAIAHVERNIEGVQSNIDRIEEHLKAIDRRTATKHR